MDCYLPGCRLVGKIFNGGRKVAKAVIVFLSGVKTERYGLYCLYIQAQGRLTFALKKAIVVSKQI